MGKKLFSGFVVCLLAALLLLPQASSAGVTKRSSQKVCKLELKKLGKKKFFQRYGVKQQALRRYGLKRTVSLSMRNCVTTKLARANDAEVKPSTTQTTQKNGSTTISSPNTTESSATTPSSTQQSTGTSVATQSTSEQASLGQTSDHLCTRDLFYYQGSAAKGCVIEFNDRSNSASQLSALGASLGVTFTITGSLEFDSHVVLTFVAESGITPTQYESIANDSSVDFIEPNTIITIPDCSTGPC